MLAQAYTLHPIYNAEVLLRPGWQTKWELSIHHFYPYFTNSALSHSSDFLPRSIGWFGKREAYLIKCNKIFCENFINPMKVFFLIFMCTCLPVFQVHLACRCLQHRWSERLSNISITLALKIKQMIELTYRCCPEDKYSVSFFTKRIAVRFICRQWQQN